MGYKEFYLARKVSKNTGFGKKVWLLKTPFLADNPSSGRNLLGSVLREIEPFLKPWYPEPRHMTMPEIILKKMNAEKSKIGFADSDELTITENLEGNSFTLTENSGFELDLSSTIPGTPVKVGLDVDYDSVKKIVFSIDKCDIQYIPTDYLSRLARLLNGDDTKIDSNVAIDISDNLIVDLIVLAKNYSVSFHTNKKISPGFEADAEVANIGYGGKFKFTKETDYIFRVEIADDNEYVIGFKTIDWDDLDWKKNKTKK